MTHSSLADHTRASQLLRSGIGRAGPIAAEWWGLALLSLLFYDMIGTYSPFTKGDQTNLGGTSLFSQLTSIGLFLMATGVIVKNPVATRRLLWRAWPLLIPLAWFFLSLLWSSHPDLTFRRAGLTVIMVITALGVAAASPTPLQFLRVALAVTGLVLSVDLLSALLVPGLGRTADGLFVGMHNHKNTAGAVAMTAFLVWLFAALRTPRFRAKLLILGIAVTWMLFLVATSAKTSIGVALTAPIAALLVFVAFCLNGLKRWIYCCLIVIAVFSIVLAILWANIGLVDIGNFIFQDLTFTGRVALWDYVLYEIDKEPWFGQGYGAFWYIGVARNSFVGAEGFAAIAGAAHNGYLDIWLQTGYIGLALTLLPLARTIWSLSHLLKYSKNGETWVYVLVLAMIIAIVPWNLMASSWFRSGSMFTMLYFIMFYLVESWRLRTADRHVEDPRGARPRTTRG